MMQTEKKFHTDETYYKYLKHTNHWLMIFTGVCIVLSGLILIVNDIFSLHLSEFDCSYLTVGCWVIALIFLIPYGDNRELLKKPEKLHRSRIKLKDERNQEIELKAKSAALNVLVVILMIAFLFGIFFNQQLANFSCFLILTYMLVQSVVRAYLRRKV